MRWQYWYICSCFSYVCSRKRLCKCRYLYLTCNQWCRIRCWCPCICYLPIRYSSVIMFKASFCHAQHTVLWYGYCCISCCNRCKSWRFECKVRCNITTEVYVSCEVDILSTVHELVVHRHELHSCPCNPFQSCPCCCWDGCCAKISYDILELIPNDAVIAEPFFLRSVE